MNRKKRENAPQEEVFMESAPPQGNDFSAGRGGRIAAKGKCAAGRGFHGKRPAAGK